MSDMDEGTPPERSSAGWTTGKSVAIPQPAITVDMPLGGQRIQRFLDELGSDAPTPGGGAWAGISAAAGAQAGANGAAGTQDGQQSDADDEEVVDAEFTRE